MENIKLITAYAGKYRKLLALAIGSTIFLVGVQLAGPQIMRILIATVKSTARGEGSTQTITMLAGALLLLYIFRGFLRFTSSFFSHKAGWGVVADARRDVYNHLQSQSLRFYEDRKTGELMSRAVNDTDKFEHLISHALPDTLVNILMLLGVSTLLIIMNAKLMLLTLIPMPLVFIAIRSFAKHVRPAFRVRQEDLADLNASLQDNFSGIREIQAFNREHSQSKHIWKRIKKFRNSNLNALKLMATFSPFIEFTSSLGTVIVLYFGGRMAFNETLPIEDLFVFFLYLEMFYAPIRVLSAAWEHTQEAVIGAERVRQLLQEEPDILDAEGCRDLPEKTEGRIEFRNVSFRYSRGDEVLKNINLEIPPKSTAALVGPTGVGKSTLVSLIPRFYDVTEGSILIDGEDIRELSLSSLRRNISIVLQDVFLFNGTLRENILFGREDSTEEEMLRASAAANAHEFISSFSDGYDTVIGERGVKLSGGQKQRISIARAILKDAPILILDEATSSVDTETEALIQEALERLMKGRTTIIIAHRLSTVRKADRIVVLQNGEIREEGTHDQLISEDGLYRKLTTIG
jgi:ATP-binding cassette subfamily B protein/subfamily B ATP-binding cassette protein MsbA